MEKKKIILFDMDGTLTRPRQQIDMLTTSYLARLQRAGFVVCIITGSDINYIQQQCSLLFDISPVDICKMHFYPCNGTKYYKWHLSELHKVYSTDFSKFVGQDTFNRLVFSLSELFSSMSTNPWANAIPLTGNFISYRGSMINFCPIGRNATLEQRSAWVELDKKYMIRKSFVKILENKFEHSRIKFKIGGQTSIDIFPCGWDKTYVFNNFDADNCDFYFVGDSCTENGNDYEIYKQVKKFNDTTQQRSFKTKGPETTRKIIENIIEDYRGKS